MDQVRAVGRGLEKITDMQRIGAGTSSVCDFTLMWAARWKEAPTGQLVPVHLTKVTVFRED